MTQVTIWNVQHKVSQLTIHTTCTTISPVNYRETDSTTHSRLFSCQTLNWRTLTVEHDILPVHHNIVSTYLHLYTAKATYIKPGGSVCACSVAFSKMSSNSLFRLHLAVFVCTVMSEPPPSSAVYHHVSVLLCIQWQCEPPTYGVVYHESVLCEFSDVVRNHLLCGVWWVPHRSGRVSVLLCSNSDVMGNATMQLPTTALYSQQWKTKSCAQHERFTSHKTLLYTHDRTANQHKVPVHSSIEC